MDLLFPYNHHPCWADKRSNLWERIHLPISPKCNLSCAYCTSSNSCHGAGPGSCDILFTPEDAFNILQKEMNHRQNLKIIGFSGPGEPLHNEEIFSFLDILERYNYDFKICLSTNGVLLSDSLDRLSKYKIGSISMSISAIKPVTASRLYGRAIIDNQIVIGEEMGEKVIQLQMKGIRDASDRGIPVKVNSILIPSINTDEMLEIAKRVSAAGAHLQNIIPLIPQGRLSIIRAPTIKELQHARKSASVYLKQFSHCAQCRSDVVGIPGKDAIIRL